MTQDSVIFCEQAKEVTLEKRDQSPRRKRTPMNVDKESKSGQFNKVQKSKKNSRSDQSPTIQNAATSDSKFSDD